MMRNLVTLLFLVFTVSLFAQQEAYSLVEQMPQYKACQDRENESDRKICAERELMKFIHSHAEFAKFSAEKKNSEAIVRFVVHPDGSLSEAFLQNRDGSFTKNAEQAVKAIFADMPDWVPGIEKGENVPVAMALPIRL